MLFLSQEAPTFFKHFWDPLSNLGALTGYITYLPKHPFFCEFESSDTNTEPDTDNLGFSLGKQPAVFLFSTLFVPQKKVFNSCNVPDPDPYVFGPPGSGSRFFHQQAKKSETS
jgi:hypothetical protein